jgi:Mor family transcriptional regulator
MDMKFEELVSEIGYRAACKVCKRWGGELHRIPVMKTHQLKQRDEKIIAEREKGKERQRIAKELGISYAIVCRVCKKYREKN